MACKKCGCVHQRFKNGRMKKMCPKKGEGMVADLLKKALTAYFLGNTQTPRTNISSDAHGAAKGMANAVNDIMTIYNNLKGAS